ncbi:MAG: hypothetical protein N3D11_07415 [Candidatus Sumerlaeia bacterium]|nr:hypothetical protein [Candidatus Sumerlaeia bacterium]
MAGSSPTPRWNSTDWLIAAGGLALAHVVFYPALRPGCFLFGTDTVAHDFGMLLYSWSQVTERGSVGLWNPYLFCGLPALATFAFCPFYPIGWLFAALPFTVAFNYQYILNVWLAGLWTYWAARWMGLTRWAACFAGTVFLVSGHLVTLAHAGHLQKVGAIAWMPLAFAGATAAVHTGRWRHWLVCGVGIAMQLLASHVQIAYYTVGFLALWTLWTVAVGPDKERAGHRAGDDLRSLAVNPRHHGAFPTWLRFGLGFGLALLAAAGLSAAQILPALEITPATNRGGGVAFEEAAETSYPPLEFAEFILPSFLGDNARGPQPAPVPYWGRWGTERIVSDYMGLLPVILAVYAWAAGRRRDRWFWLLVIAVSGVLAAGSFTPVFRFAWQWLPGLNRFRSPATILVFIAWPIALLAAQGLETFVRRAKEDAAARRRYLILLLTAMVALAVLAAGLAGRLPFIPQPTTQSNTISIYNSLQRSTLFGLTACAALALIAATCSFRRERHPLLIAALGTVFAVSFLDSRLHASRYIFALEARPFYRALLTHWADPVLQALPPPVRGIETGNEFSNRMMTRGIGSLHGYHPVHLQRYVDLLNLYSQNHAQLGRLVGEQFVLAPEGTDPGPDYRKADTEGPQVLWLREPLPPYARCPREVALVENSRTALDVMAQPDFDPFSCAVIALRDLEQAGGGPEMFASQPATGPRWRNPAASTTATARVLDYRPDRILLDTSALTSGGLLVLADLYAPGWVALVAADITHPAETLRTFPVNHALRAVMLSPRTAQILLTYHPFSFRLGLYLTLTAAAGLIALLVAMRTPVNKVNEVDKLKSGFFSAEDTTRLKAEEQTK